MLLDESGRVVAATERATLGSSHRTDPYFVNALRSDDTVFTTFQNEAGGFVFNYSRRVENDGDLAGVIVVEADLKKFEKSWAGVLQMRSW